MNGKAVCLKVLRLVIEQDEGARATVRKVLCFTQSISLLRVGILMFLYSDSAAKLWFGDNSSILIFFLYWA